MKKNYISPKIREIEICTCDIIATSTFEKRGDMNPRDIQSSDDFDFDFFDIDRRRKR